MATTQAFETVTITDEHREDLKFALGLPRGVCHKLNLADPVQHRYAMNMLKLSGETPETAPHTFATLDAARTAGEPGPPTIAEFADDEQFQVVPLNTISQFGTNDDVNFTANAYSTYPGGTNKTSILLTLVGDITAQQIAKASDSQYNAGTEFTLPASGSLPGNSGNTGVVALATFYVWSNNNPTPLVYTQSADDGSDPTAACQLQPTYKQYQSGNTCVNSGIPISTPLKACWYRTGTDCDYYSPTGQPTNFDFPVIGSLTFSSPIAVPITGMFILSLDPLTGGASILSNLNASNPGTTLPSNFTPNGNTVSWNFPASSFPNNGQLPTGGTLVNYSCFVSVGLQSTTTNTGSATFTSNSALWNNPATYAVPQIDIVYGCLAAGTRIRLLDGSELAIEKFKGGFLPTELLLVGHEHRAMPVDSTVKGKEEPPIIIVRDELGHELWLTEQHPVPTPEGVVLGSDLRAGMVVYTIEGQSKLVSVERRKYDGDVWNIKIGTPEQAERAETTFYANGILVGDLHMQRYWNEELKKRRRGDPLATLPPEWHEDYRNYVARQQKKTSAA